MEETINNYNVIYVSEILKEFNLLSDSNNKKNDNQLKKKEVLNNPFSKEY